MSVPTGGRQSAPKTPKASVFPKETEASARSGCAAGLHLAMPIGCKNTKPFIFLAKNGGMAEDILARWVFFPQLSLTHSITQSNFWCSKNTGIHWIGAHSIIHSCHHSITRSFIHAIILIAIVIVIIAISVMHAYMHACVHTDMHIVTHAYMHTCVHACLD